MDVDTIPTSSGEEAPIVDPESTVAIPPKAPNTPVTGAPEDVRGEGVIKVSKDFPCEVYRVIVRGGASIDASPRE